MAKESIKELTPAKELLLVNTFGPGVLTFSDELKAQLAQLDEDEIKVLIAIKAKLNANLTGKLRDAMADGVGVVVW